MRLVPRSAAAAVVLVALAAGCSSGGSRTSAPAPATSSPAPSTGGCDTALFVGVRGSGEPQAGGGMGAEAGDTYRRLVAKVGADRVQGVGLVYPATSVPSWLTALPGQPGSYSWSVDAGVRSLTSVVGTALAACPDRSIVVVGHSQGANVVDDYLHTAPAAALARVRAAVVYGDPTFAWDRPYARGTFEHRDGLLGTPTAADPQKQVWPALQSWCRDGDLVCQLRAGDVPGDAKKLAETILHGDLSEHVKYVQGQTAQAADFIAGRIT